MIPEPVFRTEARPTCLVCGAPGEPRYDDIPDLLLGIPGRWRVVCCAQPECGTHWLNPAPRAADLGLAYEGYVTHGSGKATRSRSAWRRRANAAIQAWRLGYPRSSDRLGSMLGAALALSPRHRALAQRELLYVPYVSEGRLLEVGCGRGQYLERLKAAGWNCVGIDFDAEAVAHAAARGLDVRVGDLAAQRFADASFDTVLLSHVIEHLPDPHAVLRECRRILKPGGRVVLLTPNVRSLGHRAAGRHWIGLEPPRHLFVFSPSSLARVLVDCGFDDVAVDTPADMALGFITADELRRDAERAGATTPFEGKPYSARALGLALLELLLCEVGLGVGDELLARARRPAA
jgi:2-polyprenyl-3-methyl-5-hydroxy-6-metoxy-1,4-benzoquinol methylase